jgi:hypothetical protein
LSKPRGREELIGSYNAWETRAIMRVVWEVMMERGMIGDNWRMVAPGEGAPGFFCGVGICCKGGGLRQGLENCGREGTWGAGGLGSSMRVGGIAILMGAFYVKTNAALHSMIMLCPGRCLGYDANDSKYNFHELFSSINVGL